MAYLICKGYNLLMITNNPLNFREIAMGSIAPGILYRSNHPIYDGMPVKEVIQAASDTKIKTVINLSDSFLSLFKQTDDLQLLVLGYLKKAIRIDASDLLRLKNKLSANSDSV